MSAQLPKLSASATILPSEGLHRFHGGIYPPLNKDMSTELALEKSTLAAELILPLSQHIGDAAIPVVAAGDYVLKGQLIAKAESYLSAAVHAPTSGTILKIAQAPIPHASGLTASCIFLKPDYKDKWIKRKTIDRPLEKSSEELRRLVREAGIVGLGGAAFPTAVKLNTEHHSKITTLIVNGAECEPYITCDQTLLTERATEVVVALKTVMHIVGSKACIIAIEDSMASAYHALKAALKKKGNAAISLKVIPTIYPTGGEKQLIKVLTGKEVPSNKLPADIGYICHNPATIVAVDRAIRYGEPLISRIVTITGNGVTRPRNLEVPFGTPISHLVAQAGGYKKHAKRLIMGGLMMGFALHSDKIPIIKASNCILVQTEQELKSSNAVFPCIRCGKCAEVCPAKLLPQQLYWYSKSAQFSQAEHQYNLFDCIECGACSYVCPSKIPLVQYYRFAKTEIRNAANEQQKADKAKQRFEFRNERIAKERAQKAALLKQKQRALENKNQAANQDAIAAAIARAKARKEQMSAATNQPHGKQPAATADAGDNAKQAAIAAAVARAKARKKQLATATAQQKQKPDSDDKKQAAIAAARARAKTKAKTKAKAKTDITDKAKPIDNSDDKKQAAIAAARARAKAKQEKDS